MWKDRFRERAEPLAGWARRANASLVPGAEPLIEEFFTPVRHWTYWHRIFREEDYPDSAEIADNAFDEETVQTAVGAVVALVELLRPHVEPHLGPGANLGSGLH